MPKFQMNTPWSYEANAIGYGYSIFDCNNDHICSVMKETQADRIVHYVNEGEKKNA